MGSSPLKLMLSLGILLVFLTGCERSNFQAELQNPKASSKTVFQNNKTVEIATSIRILAEMNVILSEVSPILTNSSEAPSQANVFQVLRKGLAQEFTDNGVLRESIGSSGKEGGKKSEMKIQACKVGNSKLVSKPNKKTGILEHALHFQECGDEKTSSILAVWRQESPGVWKFRFNVAALSSGPLNSFGRLGSSLLNEELKAQCEVHFHPEDKVIDGFLCLNLTQDAPGNSALHLKRLEYLRNRKIRTEADGIVYDLSGAQKKKKSEFKAREIPELNNVTIDIHPEEEKTATPDNQKVMDYQIQQTVPGIENSEKVETSEKPETSNSKNPVAKPAIGKEKTADNPESGEAPEDRVNPEEGAPVSGELDVPLMT